jgi:predicted dinucleotide-binding enzyme
MIVTIVGAGAMARGIAIRALAGHCVVRLTDIDATKAVTLAADLREALPAADVRATGPQGVEGADVVVLALPYPAGRQVVTTLAPHLTGAVVVDISNPVDFDTLDALLVPTGASAAEEIADAAPAGVPVVKAFNTTFAATLVTGGVAGQPLDVFLAGDDEPAKKTVAELVRAGGMRPLDVGPLRRARELEAFQLLVLGAQDRLGLSRTSGLKLLP